MTAPLLLDAQTIDPRDLEASHRARPSDALRRATLTPNDMMTTRAFSETTVAPPDQLPLGGAGDRPDGDGDNATSGGPWRGVVAATLHGVLLPSM